MARAQALALLLTVAAPALGGCLDFLNPAASEPPPISPCITQEAWVVPALSLRMDSPYGNVRVASSRALAVPVKCGAAEEGAVYFNTTAGYRADAIFQVKSRENLAGDHFIQGPLGDWPEVRSSQGWTRASDSDLAGFGFNGTQGLYERASKLLPINVTLPLAGSWLINGTMFAHIEPNNISIATEEGPFLFQRNASNFIVIENLTVLSWSVENRALDATGDALAHAEVKDPEIVDIELAWGNNRLDVTLRTPPFRKSDLLIDEDPRANITSVEYPNAAVVSMIKSTSSELRDDFVQLKSQNMTFTMTKA
jgi:hypothetical protein